MPSSYVLLPTSDFITQKITQSDANSEVSIDCIGYCTHPAQPQKSTSDILRDLAQHSSLDSFLLSTMMLGGTFFLIYRCTSGTFLIPDSGALMPCFFYHHQGITYLGSSAKQLYQALPKTAKPAPVETDFFDTAYAKKGLYLMGHTQWKGLYQLLPNHYLDLHTGKTHRYFPSAPLQKATPDEVIPDLINLLTGQWRAISCQQKPVLPLTAGWDSRVLLATAQPIINQLPFTYTMWHANWSEKHEDILIPPRLAHIAGVRHQFFFNNREASPADLQKLQNHLDAHNPRNPAMHTQVYNPHLSGLCIVSGVSSETAKRYYGEEKNITPQRLSILAGYGNHPHAIYIMDQWLGTTQSIQELGYDVLDFFHWEFNVGSSVAREVFQINLSQATVFPPFNHKLLIDTLLRVPPRYRDMYDHDVYRKLIAQCWPPLLSLPVNPNPKTRVIRTMKRMGIYSTYSNLKRKLLKKK